MKLMMKISLIALAVLLTGCRGAAGDGPDKARPRKPKTERQKSWLKEQMHREKVSDYDISRPGGNDNFQVFPHRSKSKRRSEDLTDDFKAFPW